LLLLAIYLKLSSFFSPLAGFLSAVVLAVQPVFVAQSGFILPEVCLALFVLLALCFYYEERFWLFALFALFASMAILTKES
ncbi:phospholipid carrier-dependent glycosyltransferase, partial [Enterococcus faecium]|uniref:phospholipid carrier-dependent glycosyltransferase n=1 Tax=Enterococcus faecium TaxID=1352 RepID=UPI003F43951B